MNSTNKFKAGDMFPEMELPVVGGGMTILGEPQTGYDWKLVVVYRGKHCPLCTRYLKELDALKAEFLENGIDVITVSADSETQATAHMTEVGVSYPVAYGLSIASMQQLGLYISNPRSPQETDHPFAEPGLFAINEKGQVQVLDMSNGPFARPDLRTLLNGLKWIRDPANNYPIRGTYE